MESDKKTCEGCGKGCCGSRGCGGGVSGGIYGLGFLGALIYYLGAATSFWAGVLGALKALVWPAFLVYQLLSFLH